AVRQFRRAINAERNSAEAHHHLAVALMAIGRIQEAIQRYEQALAITPDIAETHNNLAHAFETLGRMDEALTHYKRALAINPSYAEAHNNLGNVLHKLGQSEEAFVRYRKAVSINPNYAEAHDNLGVALAAVGRYEEAVACHEKALAINPNDAETQNHFGNTLDMLGRSADAIAYHKRAIAAQPKKPEFHSDLGRALHAIGKFNEASNAFATAINLTPGKVRNFWNLVSSKRFTAADPHLIAMQKLAQNASSLSVDEQIELHFALGKALADLGEHQQAFNHILQGNALKRQQIVYDEATTLQRFERIRQVFTPDLLQEKRGLGDPSEIPIFIVGMPRSGTTLVEQILASHSHVFGAGELAEMGRLAASMSGANGSEFPEATATLSGEQLRQLGANYLQTVSSVTPAAKRITDKLPGNFLRVGLIHLALPQARIIHTRRDPRDTALSCFSNLWPNGLEQTYDLAELGRYYRSYQAIMDHWRRLLPEGVMLEVQYEDVINNLEEETRRILTHCGLEWEDRCLAFHRTDRSVRTASAAQVRQPIYTSSIGRWRAHEIHLKPLLQELDG
ncbi:MAG: tetratricopeptide repeat protein, partial [Hyphomicrobiales bacterium]|nr:tetratricopeptide repeat protein [Hyphomicrobiales bacterium]